MQSPDNPSKEGAPSNHHQKPLETAGYKGKVLPSQRPNPFAGYQQPVNPLVQMLRGGNVQKKEGEDGEKVQLKQATDTVQRKKEEEEKLQMKKTDAFPLLDGHGGNLQKKPVTHLQNQIIQRSESTNTGHTGSDKVMPEGIKAKMEGSLGADFSSVQLSEGPQASALGALAYTQGDNIHFAPGQYNPTTQKGQELLGHELTHVVQQREGRVQATTQAKGSSTAGAVPVNDDPKLEQEADEMGTKAAKGQLARSKTGVGVRAVQPAVQMKTKYRDDYPWTGIVVKDAELWVGPAKASGKSGDLKKDTMVDVTNELFDCFGIIPKGKKGKGYTLKTNVDDPTSHYLDTSMVGKEMKWQPSSPGIADTGKKKEELGENNFAKWALAPAKGVIPAINKASTINCWEVVLYAAYKAGLLTWAQIHASYTKKVPSATVKKLLDPDPAVSAVGEKEIGKFVDQVLISLMTDGMKKPWDYSKPHLTRPSRGDVVLFDGAAHVSLATGEGDKIYTFWPPPNTPFTKGGTVDKVKTSTIKELYDWMKVKFGKAPVVTYYSPAW